MPPNCFFLSKDPDPQLIQPGRGSSPPGDCVRTRRPAGSPRSRCSSGSGSGGGGGSVSSVSMSMGDCMPPDADG